MGTFIAQILVGSPHPNHDGIGPSHFLFLSVNSRPAWILVNENLFEDSPRPFERKVWIPTVEHILEDAFLMIAYYICKDKNFIEQAIAYNPKIKRGRIELYSDYNGDQRAHLYELCREIQVFPKLIISVFKGSAMQEQLLILEKYSMDVEVCDVKYSRLSSGWSDDITVTGSLI